ncbi:MAG: exodeoxyribonuclease VII small subunit [Alphaproteobacteria bacterium]|nr:exodeoxyribonuclease VII small subunit [Alphaproteobacteria bacterium]
MDTKPIEDLSFEEAMSELENVVHLLESGRIKLEEAVSAYERGVKLRNLCTEKLKNAKSKIDLLVIEGDTPVGMENFDEQLNK